MLKGAKLMPKADDNSLCRRLRVYRSELNKRAATTYTRLATLGE
jgi:hypothetical protein